MKRVLLVILILGLFPTLYACSIVNTQNQKIMTDVELKNINLYTFVKDNKWGYIDQNGNIIIKPKYKHAGNFYEDLAAVWVVEKLVFINKSGQIVFEVGNKLSTGGFHEGIAYISKGEPESSDGCKYYFIDRTGRKISSKEYDYANNMSDGLALATVKSGEGNKAIFIDKTGNEVLSINCDEVNDFSEGLASIKINNKYGYIDKKGNTLIYPEYEEAYGFSEGLAVVKKDGKYGYINYKGSIVIKPKYDFADTFSEGYAVVEENDKKGYIDKKGDYVLLPEVADGYGAFLKKFSEGLAKVQLENNKYESMFGYINKNGKMVIEPKFDDAKDFHNGLALIKYHGKWLYINKKGDFIIKPDSNYAAYFDETN